MWTITDSLFLSTGYLTTGWPHHHIRLCYPYQWMTDEFSIRFAVVSQQSVNLLAVISFGNLWQGRRSKWTVGGARRTCKTCPTRGVWGHAPPGNFRICTLWDWIWSHLEASETKYSHLPALQQRTRSRVRVGACDGVCDGASSAIIQRRTHALIRKTLESGLQASMNNLQIYES